ncbi:MAG: DUF5132 domain-containing protein [Pseudonocardiaceae bacterium]
MAVVAPYLIGVVTAPLVARVFKPLFRGVIKTTLGVAMEAKKAAAEVREEFQDIAAEATVERAVADEAAGKPTRPGAATQATTKTTGVTGASRGADVTR